MRVKKVRFQKSGALVALEQPTPVATQRIEAELTYDFIKHIRGMESKMHGGRHVLVTPVYCYKHITDPDEVFPPKIVFPAGYFPRVAKAFKADGYKVLLKDTRTKSLPEPQWQRLRPAVQFRYRQRECLEKMATSRYGGQLVCPTGYGKGLLIRCFCQLFPHLRIDVSTHSLDVLDQIYWDLKMCIPGVGIDSSGHKRQGDGRINLYSGKSLHHSDGKADVLIVDEGHEWGTADYIERIARYRNARRFMFSATPKRPDGAHFELEGAFGPPLVEISYPEAVEYGCIVPIMVDMLDVIMDENPADGCVDTAKERWGIWRNKVRNEILAEAAESLGRKEQTLITVKTLEHAAFLKKLLPHFTLAYSEATDRASIEGYINWNLLPTNEPYMTRDRRRALKERFETGKLKKVIATPVWNRGVNFRDLAVLIRGDASDSRISDSQIPGRTSRLPDRTDKEYGRVIDCLDQFDAGYRRKASHRKACYKENQWEVNMPERYSKLRDGYTQQRLF